MNSPRSIYKATKIVATIGPTTQSEAMLTELVKAGMNVARFNTKHSDPSWHHDKIKKVRKVSQRLKKSVGILLDLQGPEIRIDLPQDKSFQVDLGERVTFTTHPADTKAKEKVKSRSNTIFVPLEVIKSLSVGDQIMLEDGSCEFQVIQKHSNSIVAEARIGCQVNDRKTMNTPGVVLNMPSLTDRDREYLDKIHPEEIDFVGLSFVRDVEDIKILKKELAKRKITAHIVSKIENQSSIDNLDDIIETSDAIMIARGDLGVELPFQKLVHWQKKIIAKCRLAAIPVITATEMLKSMVENPRATRAEVSDVAHAIYDGTDAIMLSEETAVGKYPIRAVSAQAIIASFNEQYTDLKFNRLFDISKSASITHAAISLLETSKQKISKIICLTQTGRTAQLVARFRPRKPIHAVTNNLSTYHRLSLLYGATPHLVPFSDGVLETNSELIRLIKKYRIAKSGETVLLIHGSVWKKPGLSNTLVMLDMP